MTDQIEEVGDTQVEGVGEVVAVESAVAHDSKPSFTNPKPQTQLPVDSSLWTHTDIVSWLHQINEHYAILFAQMLPGFSASELCLINEAKWDKIISQVQSIPEQFWAAALWEILARNALVIPTPDPPQRRRGRDDDSEEGPPRKKFNARSGKKKEKFTFGQCARFLDAKGSAEKEALLKEFGISSTPSYSRLSNWRAWRGKYQTDWLETAVKDLPVSERSLISFEKSHIAAQQAQAAQVAQAAAAVLEQNKVKVQRQAQAAAVQAAQQAVQHQAQAAVQAVTATHVVSQLASLGS